MLSNPTTLTCLGTATRARWSPCIRPIAIRSLYSYDWIDNDGQPSADRILPQLQPLQVGDQILMLPEMGPRVREVEPNRYFVAGDQEAGVWCLALYPTARGCRLISRWWVDWPLTPATAFWILLSDPGAFIMERKMLKGIRSRAEAMVQDRSKECQDARVPHGGTGPGRVPQAAG
jgi:hypothetical protein